MLKVQLSLRKKIIFKNLTNLPNIISGFDAVYIKNYAVGVLVTFNYSTKKMVECTYAIDKIFSQYKSGFLAFHELPIFLKTYSNLTINLTFLFTSALNQYRIFLHK